MAATNYSNYYDNKFTSYSLPHPHDPTLAPVFGYFQAGHGLMYPQYLVPVQYLYYQPQYFVPWDDSWFMNMNPDVAESNYYDNSWILNDQEEEEEEEEETVLTEEELRLWNLVDEEIVVYDSTHDGEGMSEETVTKHLNTRGHHRRDHPVNANDICVVCQECLFQNVEKVATLDCGHDFHSGCIKKWLMLKNCCPLCKATAVYV